VFSKNPDYWRGEPGFETVIFRVLPDEFSRAAALEAGEVDIAYLLSDTSLDRLRNAANVEVHSLPGMRKFIAPFNAEMPEGEPLLDPRVRQALNHAVDVQGIVDAVFDGNAYVLGGAFALPGEFGYTEVEPFEYDPELARTLIAEAGYPNGFPVTFAYTVGRYPKDQELGEIIASYLSAVGLTVTQRPLEWGQFNTERSARTLGHIFAFGLLFPPDLENTFTYMAFGKEARGAPLLTWSDRWWDLYERSTTAVDPDERAGIYAEMLTIDREEPYGIYLFAPNDAYGSRDTITGFQPREDQFLFLYDVRPRN
jgi:peptide/nickel transport system substrate-binding protein